MFLRPDDSMRRAEGASLDSKITKNPSAAQSRHLGRHAAMMSLYYALRDSWSNRVSNAQNVDYANGRFDSRRQADVKDYLDRHNDHRPIFKTFLQDNGWMLRNPDLWFDENQRFSENPTDRESGLRWDDKMKTWWYDEK